MKKSGTNMILSFVMGLHLVATNLVAAQEKNCLVSAVDAAAAFENDSDAVKLGPASGSVRERRLISTNDLLRTLQDANFEGAAIGIVRLPRRSNSHPGSFLSWSHFQRMNRT